MKIPLVQQTCWELCQTLERSIKGLGTDENCPVSEMAPIERDVLLTLLSQIADAKETLARVHGMDDIEYAAFQRQLAEA